MTRKTSTYTRRRMRAAWQPELHYSSTQLALASRTEPLPNTASQLVRMETALASIARDQSPSVHSWRLLSDAVNMMETLTKLSPVRVRVVGGRLDEYVIKDESGLLNDAVQALAEAGCRHVQQQAPIRLSGPGIQAVRAVLADYADLVSQLPAWVLLHCHRETERRLHQIRRGERQDGDIEIVEI